MKYKPEQEVELRTAYEAADTDADRKAVVLEFATKFQTSKHSIIGKLTSMGVYKKPSPLNKQGEPIVAKQEYVNFIRIMLGVKDGDLESLEKASKRDLVILRDRLVQMNDEFTVNS
jgi:hypothetical protein